MGSSRGKGERSVEGADRRENGYNAKDGKARGRNYAAYEQSARVGIKNGVREEHI